jgi:alpha-methylacyl-CoA racemase
MRPLNGLLVLDFSTLLPGPLASLLLAEAGAQVIKVERPGSGEDMRSYEPPWGAASAIFALLNRGKKSIALNLKDPADKQRLLPLIERADIIVEQFRPGVMQRLGLDYDTLAAINPKLIYCSISGYGQRGPKRDKVGHDLNLIAETGFLALSMGDPQHAVMPPTAIADIAGGAYPAMINILLALAERTQTGRGRHLDVSMSDGLFSLSYWALGVGWATGRWPGNQTDLVNGGTPRYRLYASRDGKAIAAAPLEQRFWETFCDIIALPTKYRDDNIDPKATTDAIAHILRSEDADVWHRRFSARECCCSVVVDMQSAVSDPHFKARGLFDHILKNEAGAQMSALPVPIDAAFRASPEAPLSAPPLGCDNGILPPVQVPSAKR